MAAEQQLDHYRRQANRYCFEDGFMEMVFGTIFLVMAIGMFLMFSVDHAYMWIVTIGFLVVVFSLAFGASRLVGGLKERITYLRSGYVETGNHKAIPRWVEIAGALTIIGVSFVMPNDFPQPAIINAMGVTFILGTIAYRVGLSRLYGVMFLAIALGFVVFYIGDVDVIQAAGPFASTGVLLLISGGLTFYNYLHTHPVEAD